MQVLESMPSSQWKEEEEDELPVPPWKKVTLATALPDGAGLNDENHVHTAGKASVAASPPMMSPKSSAVAKASAVTGAPPQPAAVPKPKLFTTASTPSTDLKPSAAADTMSLKVNTCICILLYAVCMCNVQLPVCSDHSVHRCAGCLV